MTIVYEVYQGISACCVMIVHAQVPEFPPPMEGPKLSFLRQCIFEVLFKQVSMSVAFYYKPQTGFHTCIRWSPNLWSDSNFLSGV